MVYNENTKQSHYKWRENNIDQYREYIKKGAKKYYESNKVEQQLKSLKKYYLKKEMNIFRHILL